MSLASWINGITSALSPAKEVDMDHTSVAILSELDYQMYVAEERMQAIQQEQRRIEMGGCDYSWLVATKPKFYEMSEVERLQLEELCRCVAPAECSAVIRSFREAILGEEQASRMPIVLRSIIHQVIEARSQSTGRGGQTSSSGMPQWLSRSLTSLKSLHIPLKHNSVSAIGNTNFDGDRRARSPSMELSTIQSFFV